MSKGRKGLVQALDLSVGAAPVRVGLHDHAPEAVFNVSEVGCQVFETQNPGSLFSVTGAGAGNLQAGVEVVHHARYLARIQMVLADVQIEIPERIGVARKPRTGDDGSLRQADGQGRN